MPLRVQPGSLVQDTAPAALELQERLLRQMPGEQRLALALEMSLLARSLLEARLRREHPEWAPARCRAEVCRLMTGHAPGETR